MRPGFKSRERHFFYVFFFFFFFLSLFLQCKFANSALLSLLSFSCFITPYDAQASSAFGALILYSLVHTHQETASVYIVEQALENI